MKNVLKVKITVKSGARKELEVGVRVFHRRVFLDESRTPNERAFWLTKILKAWPVHHHGRILYILYGPLCLGKSKRRRCRALKKIRCLKELEIFIFAQTKSSGPKSEKTSRRT